MNLIDLPRRCEQPLYRSAVEKVVDALSFESYVDAIYQLGRVAHPGISDVDLLVVVAEEAASSVDPLDGLSPAERHLFTHSCLLVPVSLARELPQYVLLGGYLHVHGTDWGWAADAGSVRALEVQTGLEFLAKNVVDLYVQLTYRLLKVRVLLQHVKGVRLDLELLGTEADGLPELLWRFSDLTDRWFVEADSAQQVTRLAAELFPLMHDALAEAIAEHELYAPFEGAIPFASNVRLERGSMIELEHRGVRLPRLPGLDGRRYFNAHHRVNRFRVKLPMTGAAAGSFHAARFDYLRAAKAFVRERFPAYSAPIPPLFYRAL
jgi:hypothetical protein